MHLILLFFLTIHNVVDTSGIPFHWERTTRWKMYALNNSSKVFAIPPDSMRTLAAVPMNDDSIHLLLANTKLYQVPMSPAWMGCYLTSCENDKGQFMKIVVSVYGGFFLDEFDGKYYHIDPASTRRWLDYLRRSYIKTE
jgi:hypothetical protein